LSKLLLLDDDVAAGQTLQRGLSQDGFVVDVCTNGEDGLHAALSTNYKIVLLDVDLPRLDGWGVLTGLRAEGCMTPVMLLTARDTVRDRVRGLDLGADDVLCKPFAYAELLARVRAMLRRHRPDKSEVLKFKDLQVDVRRCMASRSNIVIDLSVKELMLLALLLEHQGDVLSRSFIGEQVWDMNFESDSNIVDVNIRRLRAKIDEPFAVPVIHTVRGRGYVLR
jgi:two-component system, OmpR family, copper resistance phosphate regulon response regulator CusR